VFEFLKRPFAGITHKLENDAPFSDDIRMSTFEDPIAQASRAIVEAANVAGIGLTIFAAEPPEDLDETDDFELPKILYINDAALAICGWTSDEITGHPIAKFVAKKNLPEIRKKWKEFQSGERLRDNFELTFIHKAGHPVPVSIGLTRATLGAHEPVIIAFLTNIAERKQAEEALLAAKAEAEEISRLKSIILSNFSHELRTPLHSILGFGSLLEDELPEGELREYARSVLSSGRRLLSTVTSIIELASLESNPSEMVLYPFLLSEELETKAEEFRPLMRDRGLRLYIDIRHRDQIVLLDKDRFAKALDKIVVNAIKFTHAGSVRIELSEEIRSRPHGPPEERAVIRIRDTGIGMSREFAKAAFEKFKQESTGTSRSYEGSGLGLPLARSYTKLMNGDIGLTSEPGKGTEVWMSFPIVAKLNPAATPTSPMSVRAR